MGFVFSVFRSHIHGLLEFVILLLIGIVVVAFIMGSWSLTPTLIFVDIVQNLIVFGWLKYKKRIVLFLKQFVGFVAEDHE